MVKENITQSKKEEWRPVSGFIGLYEVSSEGRVRSLHRTIVRKDGKRLFIPGKILNAKPNNRGYPKVSMCHKGTAKEASVHSIVAAAFLPKPPGPMGSKRGEYNVNHKDGDKTNNCMENLEYITNLDNVIHARKTGLLDVRGTGNGRAKLDSDSVRKIRTMYAQGHKQVELAAQFSICQTTISRVILRKGWGHIN